jgi:Fe-S-cluster containining protein
MKTFKETIHSPKGDYLSFYFFYGLFVINDKVLKSKKLKRIFWDMLKLELFYVGGACQNSGACCKQMLIVKDGKDIRSEKDFLALKGPKYERFRPSYDKQRNIKHVSCDCLTKDNFCSDYENRPVFCHNFPFSTFLVSDYIRSTCGYNVSRKSIRPVITNKTLKKLVHTVDLLNNLDII